MLEPLKTPTVYSAKDGGSIANLIRHFTPDIRLALQDGTPADMYYRIESDGEGVLVVKAQDEPQMMDRKTNDNHFNETPSFKENLKEDLT